MTALLLRAPGLTRDQRGERLRRRVVERLNLNGLERPRDPVDYLYAGEAKYGEAFWHAEDLKQQMRLGYIRLAPPGLTFDAHADLKRRAYDFWAEVEEVNRVWLPEDPMYASARGGFTLATTTDIFTLTSGASGQDRVCESTISGEATASAVNRVAFQRSTGGATPTNQTPEKLNTRSPAAASTTATTWTTQPTLSGNAAFFHAFNAFGGSDRWVPAPGQEFYLVNGELCSVRSASGTSVVSYYVHWEEL